MKGIKAVGFDYGGVLAGIPFYKFEDNLSKVLDVTVDELKNSYYKFNTLFDEQKISLEEMWRRITIDLQREGKLDEVLQVVKDFGNPQLNSAMIKLMDALGERYKIGVLSNASKEDGQLMRHQGIQDHCDALMVSGEIGFSKPDPKAFQRLLDELEVEASQLVFIDDSPRSLSTADEVGYTPVQFIDRNDLVGKLKKLGVEV